MASDERDLKHFVDRQLPSPTHMEFTAARDRVLDQMRGTPSHLLTPRIADVAPVVSRWRTGAAIVAAAALIALVAALPFRQAGWIATVEAADGSSYRLEPNTVLSAKDPRGLQLTLKDGARVEMRSASELSLEAGTDGIGIRLLAGDIIVNAVAQRDRRLAVHTRDMTISVAGTMSLVKTVEDGSRVAAITGDVRVHERGFETVLHPGEQFSTSPTLNARPLGEDIAWIRNADSHSAIRDAFMKGIAQTTGPLTQLARQVDAPGAQTPTPAAVNAQAAGPEFEEASIRECDPDNLPPSLIGARGGGANSVMVTPGRFYALCVTPVSLIRTSYGYRGIELEALLPDGPDRRGGRAPIRGRFGVVGSIGAGDGGRVRGGPDWIRNERITIEAVASGDPDAATMGGPMVRALFERRFKLKTHVETEQTLAYNLVVAPGGLKIKPVPAGSCEVPPQAGSPPSVFRGQVSNTTLVNGLPRPIPRPLAELRRAAKPSCAELGGPNGPNWVMLAGEATFGELTQFLRGRLGNGIGVTDKTGISDKFNWDLEFLVDANASAGVISGIIPDADAKVARAPTIFDALEQQLGLRLEPVQVPRTYLVIDSIEKPGPN